MIPSLSDQHAGATTCRRNPGPLAVDPLRNRQQSEQSHQHAEDAEWLGGTAGLDPGADEECPGEGDDGAESDESFEFMLCLAVVGARMGVPQESARTNELDSARRSGIVNLLFG